MAQDPIRVDIVSDVVCPWCIVGYRQLILASEATGVAIETFWHPFELNPDMRPEGQNVREHIIEKYGTTPEQSEVSRRQMTTLGTELGFDFRFAESMRMHNTFNALGHVAKRFMCREHVIVSRHYGYI